MEEALRAHLLAGAQVTALAGQRIDWGLRVSGDSLPAVRLTLVSGVPFYTYAGQDSLVPSRVQVDCFGRSYGDAKRVARAVKTRLAGLKGNGFDSVFLDAERDGDDVDAAGKPLARTSLDFRIWHHRPN